jgi:hypothetical protein
MGSKLAAVEENCASKRNDDSLKETRMREYGDRDTRRHVTGSKCVLERKFVTHV